MTKAEKAGRVRRILSQLHGDERERDLLAQVIAMEDRPLAELYEGLLDRVSI